MTEAPPENDVFNGYRRRWTVLGTATAGTNTSAVRLGTCGNKCLQECETAGKHLCVCVFIHGERSVCFYDRLSIEAFG